MLSLTLESIRNEPWVVELRRRQLETKAAGGTIQCTGCLLYFRPDEVTKMCECGAFFCSSCFQSQKTVLCYCDC